MDMRSLIKMRKSVGYKTKPCGTQDYGGLLWGEQGTPARQIHLIVCWGVWEPVGAKTISDNSCFAMVYPVIWVGGCALAFAVLVRCVRVYSFLVKCF